MKWKQIEGKWDQLKGSVKERWGKLTDNDLTVINGRRDKLLGMLKERYGYAEDKAEDDIESFVSSCGCESDTPSRPGSTHSHV